MFFTQLPRDILINIYMHLSPNDIPSQERVCKLLKEIAGGEYVWKYFLHQLVGRSYQKKEGDLRTSKDIYIQTIQHLPQVAQEFLYVIGAEKPKNEIEEDDDDDFQGDDSIDCVIDSCERIPNMTSLYSVIKYLFEHKEHFPALAKDDDLTASGLPYKLVHIAAAYNDSDSLELLKETPGKNLNTKDRFTSYTPLHFAAEFNSFAAAATLLSLGADLLAENCMGDFPMELAALKLNYRLLNLLYVDSRYSKDNYHKTFLDHFIRCLVHEENTFEKISEQKFDLKKIYSLKNKFLKENPDHFAEDLQSKLDKSEYSVMKCIDFFISKGCSVPEWFSDMLENIEIESNTSKLARLS